MVSVRAEVVLGNVASHTEEPSLHVSLSPDVVLSLIGLPDVLCVTVIQGQDGWGVTYTSTQICAVEGSTVNIHCSYTYPYLRKGSYTRVEKTLWFTKKNNNEPVDLITVSEYSGRVQYSSNNKDCTLRISDLRERDSAVYEFRFITNQEGGRYTGSPGVTLSVTGNIFINMLNTSRYTNTVHLKTLNMLITINQFVKLILTKNYS